MIIFMGIFIILYTFYIYSLKPVNDNPSIGETKIVNGVEYFNIGTLEDEDNWIELGSAIVQCYVNVYKVNDGYIAKIEEDMNDKAHDYVECYDYAEAERRLGFMKQVYQ